MRSLVGPAHVQALCKAACSVSSGGGRANEQQWTPEPQGGAGAFAGVHYLCHGLHPATNAGLLPGVHAHQYHCMPHIHELQVNSDVSSCGGCIDGQHKAPESKGAAGAVTGVLDLCNGVHPALMLVYCQVSMQRASKEHSSIYDVAKTNQRHDIVLVVAGLQVRHGYWPVFPVRTLSV